VTSGDGSGTNGGNSVTNGWRFEWPPFLLILAVCVVVAVVDATSVIMESQTGGTPIDPRAAWLFEVSSVLMVVVLAPFIGWTLWRVPPRLDLSPSGWARFGLLHLTAACLFSLVHVAGMASIRIVGYAATGNHYDFAYQGDFVLPFLYELRKDILTYAAVAVGYWAWGFWQAQRAAQALAVPTSLPRVDDRIEIRDGARVILIEPAQIAWIEAAGNYVEIHAGGATHLARGTLAAFEEKLASRGFVRIHRSRLINRARISAFKPTPSGDLEITLDDGRMIAGSRRFRAALDS
jgi:LytTr DNA-binding domain